MTFDHTVLVTAAGGNIGSELTPLLLSGNNKLVLPTSNASRLQSKLPSHANSSNVAVEEGSIQNPIWVQSILTKHNVDVVFLCLTGTDELITTLNFFDSMQRAGCVRHLVYLSACADFTSPEGIATLMKNCSAAHVLVKSTLEQKLAHAEFTWKTTIIGPALFMSNDLRSKKSMLEHGIFDEPLGEKGVARVAPSDIALAIRNVISNPSKYAGKKIRIGSLQTYKGSEIAELWSQATGRKIVPCGTDAEALGKFEEHFAEKTGKGANWGRDLRLMYDTFVDFGFGMSEHDYKEQVECLGKEPEDYPAWVKRVGESWRA